MNYSVGFRAPNTRELIGEFADYVLQREGKNYYSDRMFHLALILRMFCLKNG